MLSTFQGIRSQTSQCMAMSQAISSFSAITMVWKEPFSLVPPYPINSPGTLITQALTPGRLVTGPDPATGNWGRCKVRNTAPQKASVKRPFKVPHVRLKLQVPEL